MTLNEWMEEKDLTDAKVAEMAGVHRATITKLRLGTSRPSLQMVVTIAYISGNQVMLNDWLDNE